MVRGGSEPGPDSLILSFTASSLVVHQNCSAGAKRTSPVNAIDSSSGGPEQHLGQHFGIIRLSKRYSKRHKNMVTLLSTHTCHIILNQFI